MKTDGDLANYSWKLANKTGLFSESNIICSTSGETIVSVGQQIINNNPLGIYSNVSKDGGKTWTSYVHVLQTNSGFNSLCCDNDCKNIYGVLIDNITIVYSNNSGETFDFITSDGIDPTYIISSIACDGTGSHLFLSCVDNLNSNIFLFTYNTKTSSSWTQKYTHSGSQPQIVCDENGHIITMTGVDTNGKPFIIQSKDSDHTFTFVSFQHGLPTPKAQEGYYSLTCNKSGSVYSVVYNTLDYSILYKYENGNWKEIYKTEKNQLGNIYINHYLFWVQLNEDGSVISFLYGITEIDAKKQNYNYTFYLYVSVNGGTDFTKQTNGLPNTNYKIDNAIITPNPFFYFSDIFMNNKGDKIISLLTSPESFSSNKNTKSLIYIGTEPNPISNICFAADTQILCDQGYIAIDKLVPDLHTMNGGNKIVALSKTQNDEPYWVKIQKHALGKNIPFQTTRVTPQHLIHYEDAWVPACELAERTNLEGVKKIVYHDETVYNVLLEKHSNMIANGLTAETLNPRSHMALYFKEKAKKIKKIRTFRL
jgi:hypothetical protein